VLVKAEPTAKGSHPRFLVPNLAGDAQKRYGEVGCARGKWKTGSKNSTWGCLPTGPVAMAGGSANFVGCFRSLA
jgi:hypothetical protein